MALLNKAITIACCMRVGQGINILICLLPKGMKYCLLYNGIKYSLLCWLNFKKCLCLLLYRRGISVKVSNKSQTQKFTDVRNTDYKTYFKLMFDEEMITEIMTK